MAKNDELKERIAESRHKDIILLMYGALGLAGVSVVIAFALWQSSPVFLLFTLVVAILIYGAESLVKQNKRKREKLIEQLGNTAKKPAPDNNTKEPTNEEIMNEIKKGNKTTLSFSMAILGVSLAIAGLLLILQSEYQIYGWMFIILGVAIAVLSLLPFPFRKNK